MLNAKELTDKYKLGLPSFDIGGGNVDFIEAAFVAASRVQRGMYLSSTPSTVKSYMGYKNYVNVIHLIAEQYPNVDYAIHLDHATYTEDVMEALRAGYSSVMYDGSLLELPINILKTREMVKVAADHGSTVEAEIGCIGGKEDELEMSSSLMPSVEEVLDFAEKTGAFLIAPAVGTVHGHFKGKPQLNWKVIEQLALAKGCFVLHGCTGLEMDTLRKISRLGFVKFNFATALRECFRRGVLNHIRTFPNEIKPFSYLKAGRSTLTDYMVILFSLIDGKH